MKKHICFLLITALLCSSLSGCVSTAVGDDEFVPKGGEMLMEGEEPEDLSLQDEELQSLSLTYFPNRSMNPLIGNNITNRVLFSLIYQGLFSVDRNNNPVPILCSYYQATSDNRNYTIYIETGARFSDGSPLTVADVQWWRFYGDSTLCQIIERTLDNNRDMLAAAARVERLRELYRVSRAERLPSVTGTAYGDYETNDYAGEKSSRDPGFGAKVTLSWELDLWGNLRWAKRKGGAEYLASVEDRRAMRMTLVASVAAAYFNLIALDNELSIVRRTLITRSEGLYQVQLRFEGGLTSEMVYQQAKVEYASTAALIPDLERKIKIMENGILLLMGENPDRRVVRGKMNTDAEFADSLPVGLPSGLLQRRPDVRSSEQRLRAAMAAAGMAYADRFPRLTFNLTGGLENDALSGFFRSPFSYVAGTLASPIFGFGRKQARYRAALAAYDEARLAYEQKVLTVFKEADDAVITYRSARKTAALKLNLRDAASKYVELAHLQYRAGSTNYIDVLDAQRRYFDAQIGLSNSVRDEHLALVQLYKALGGGWTE